MAQAALELINATKSFDGRPAVQGLSFSVPHGQIVGFLGPNGAGKSTTLRIGLGVVPPDSGQALLFGERPNLKSLRRVGFLPEERGLYRRMSPRAIIAYFARFKGMKNKDALRRADELLKAHGLGDVRRSRVSRLSKGMAQKVQILTALAHRPDLIILDEPFSGLDPVNQQDLEALIRQEHARGATILFSTHVMEHAERLCDQLVIIGNGEKRFQGSMDEALTLAPSTAQLTLTNGFDLAAALIDKGLTARRISFDTLTNQSEWVVELPPGQSPQDVLRAAIEVSAPIIAFSPHIARLRDVFVKLTGDTARVRNEKELAPEPATTPAEAL